MLPKENRLPKEAFGRILKTGRRSREGFLTLAYSTNSEGKIFFGIVITKKTVKTAVERNKIKRQIRNILISEIIPTQKTGIEGLLMVYPGIKEKKFNELKGDIISIFKRI